jgi:hypothetical protein
VYLSTSILTVRSIRIELIRPPLTTPLSTIHYRNLVIDCGDGSSVGICLHFHSRADAESLGGLLTPPPLLVSDTPASVEACTAPAP